MSALSAALPERHTAAADTQTRDRTETSVQQDLQRRTHPSKRRRREINFINHGNIYINQCEGCEPRMKEIVDELQEISAPVKDKQKTNLNQRRPGVRVGLVPALIGFIICGLVGAAVAAGAAGAVELVKKKKREAKEDEDIKKVNELTEEFRNFAESLTSQLKCVESAYRDLCGEARRAQDFKLNTLENNKKELLDMTAELRPITTLDESPEAADTCRKAHDKLTEIKTEIECFMY